MSKPFNLIEFLLNALQIQRTSQFIRHLSISVDNGALGGSVKSRIWEDLGNAGVLEDELLEGEEDGRRVREDEF